MVGITRTALVGLALCFVVCSAAEGYSWDYSSVLADANYKGITFSDLPGFTRSVYERNYALVTPESHVWAGLPGWTRATTAHLISPAAGANFAMYLARLQANGTAAGPAKDSTERIVFVLDGSVVVKKDAASAETTLHAGDFAFFPAGSTAAGAALSSPSGAGLVVYEKAYKGAGGAAFSSGAADARPLERVPGEVFDLRRLLPVTADYDFNIHIMDFQPGEHLTVKEVHYNQHGLLLLAGKGIYRLGNDWYPVQTGDAIFMAPFVPQWYAALGTEPTRYLIFKDTTMDPLDVAFAN